MSEQIGQPYGWNWVANDGAVDLNLKAIILDITDGSPGVPHAEVPMFHNAFGSYTGVFTPMLIGRVYNIISVVYLDALFVNPDPDRPRGSITFETVDFGTSKATGGGDLILPIKAAIMADNNIKAVVDEIKIDAQVTTEQISVTVAVDTE